MKTFFKIITLIGLGLVLLLLLAIGILYYLANKAPEHYQPATLTDSQKKEVSKDFKGRMDSLYLKAVSNQGFSQTYSREELNKYIISLDEIAQKQSGRQSSIYKKMDEAGFSKPAIHLRSGHINFMALSHEYDKVLSLEIAITATKDEKLKVKLVSTRIGTLDIPKDFLLDRMDLVEDQLNKEKSGQKNSGTIQTGDIAEVMRLLLTGLNKEPFHADIVLGRPLRITNVIITPENITITFIPLDPDKP